jgi:uncharacterized protein YhhL (DUF1145 family)
MNNNNNNTKPKKENRKINYWKIFVYLMHVTQMIILKCKS